MAEASAVVESIQVCSKWPKMFSLKIWKSECEYLVQILTDIYEYLDLGDVLYTGKKTLENMQYLYMKVYCS